MDPKRLIIFAALTLLTIDSIPWPDKRKYACVTFLASSFPARFSDIPFSVRDVL